MCELGTLTNDRDDGVVAPALRCAHLTPEGLLEEVGDGGTGHHQIHRGVWEKNLWLITDHCSRVDELWVPVDVTFWVIVDKWGAGDGYVHSLVDTYVIANGELYIT